MYESKDRNNKTTKEKYQKKPPNNLKHIINSVSVLFYRFMFPFRFFIHFPISNFKKFE